jgi:sodium-dependent dicarboxylate transporter 2/3/5
MSESPAGGPSRARWAALLGGPLLFLLVWLFADPVPGRPEAAAMAAVIAWVALWWFTEPVDLAVTSLLPFLLLPLLGIAPPG